MEVTAAENLKTRSNKRKMKTWGLATKSRRLCAIIFGELLTNLTKWGAISQLRMWSSFIIQFSGPRPGWGRTRHCTAGGRRCPWRRWRWRAIRHRPNLTFYTTNLAPHSARDVAMLLSKSTLRSVEDGFLNFIIWNNMFFTSWVDIDSAKTLTSTCHHSVPCDSPTYSSRHVEKERRQTRYPVGGEGFETSQKNSPCLGVVNPLKEFFADLCVNILVVLALHTTKQP